MLYTGIDIIEIRRIARAIERWGPRFLERVFTAGELADCHVTDAGGGNVASLAARWAAKEATAKALGVGVRGLGAGVALVQQDTELTLAPIGWHEVEVVRPPGSRPTLHLHGSAAAIATHLGIATLALSLSHTRDLAVASVVGWDSRDER